MPSHKYCLLMLGGIEDERFHIDAYPQAVEAYCKAVKESDAKIELLKVHKEVIVSTEDS